jgi:hypothetical protein
MSDNKYLFQTPLSYRSNTGGTLPSVLLGALLITAVTAISLKFLTDFSKADQKLSTHIDISQTMAKFGRRLSSNFLARIRGTTEGYELISCMKYTSAYSKPHIACPIDKVVDNFPGIRINRRFPDDSIGRFIMTTGCRSLPTDSSHIDAANEANAKIGQRCGEGATLDLAEGVAPRIGQCKKTEQTVIEMRRERFDANGIPLTFQNDRFPAFGNADENKILGAALCASRIMTIQNKFELIFAVKDSNDKIGLQIETVTLNLNKTLAPSLFEFVGSN